MKHKPDAIDKANELIDLYTNMDLSYIDCVKASIIAIELMQEVGIYPGYQSLYQRTLNYFTEHLKHL